MALRQGPGAPWSELAERRASLSEFFDYDNRPFEDSPRALGFTIRAFMRSKLRNCCVGGYVNNLRTWPERVRSATRSGFYSPSKKSGSDRSSCAHRRAPRPHAALQDAPTTSAAYNSARSP